MNVLVIFLKEMLVQCKHTLQEREHIYPKFEDYDQLLLLSLVKSFSSNYGCSIAR